MRNKVAPGAKLLKSPIGEAGFINDVIDVVNDFKSKQFGRPTADPAAWQSTDIVWVQNLTGSNRLAGDIVQLGSSLLTDIDVDAPWFQGNTVAAPATSKYAVLLSPAAVNDIVMAQMAGVCVASVDVASTGDKFATPVASQTYLLSGSGPIEILSPITSTGTQLLWVRLQVGLGAFLCTIASDMAAASYSGSTWTLGSGAATLWTPTASGTATQGSPTVTFTVYNSTLAAIKALYSDGVTYKLLQGKYINGLPFIDVEGCS